MIDHASKTLLAPQPQSLLISMKSQLSSPVATEPLAPEPYKLKNFIILTMTKIYDL